MVQHISCACRCDYFHLKALTIRMAGLRQTNKKSPVLELLWLASLRALRSFRFLRCGHDHIHYIRNCSFWELLLGNSFVETFVRNRCIRRRDRKIEEISGVKKLKPKTKNLKKIEKKNNPKLKTKNSKLKIQKTKKKKKKKKIQRVL